MTISAPGLCIEETPSQTSAATYNHCAPVCDVTVAHLCIHSAKYIILLQTRETQTGIECMRGRAHLARSWIKEGQSGSLLDLSSAHSKRRWDVPIRLRGTPHLGVQCASACASTRVRSRGRGPHCERARASCVAVACVAHPAPALFCGAATPGRVQRCVCEETKGKWGIQIVHRPPQEARSRQWELCWNQVF